MNNPSPRQHIPVMLEVVIDSLMNGASQGVFVDATYGRGGHSREILNRLNDRGKLLALDCDGAAIDAARVEHHEDQRFEAIHARFSRITSELQSRSPDIKVSGILADLGVSSPQLDEPARGFSFHKDGPVDMRMNPDEGMPASQWLDSVSENSLRQVLRTLGEEKFARRIARNIVESRTKSPIRSTTQLAQLVKESVPTVEPHKHPATRTFQAIRMHINQELEELKSFLPQCIDLLKRGGRLVVITFHSLETRIVRRYMIDASVGSPGPAGIPFRQSEFRPTLKIIGKAIRPDSHEIDRNRRARSAVMWVAERIGGESNA